METGEGYPLSRRTLTPEAIQDLLAEIEIRLAELELNKDLDRFVLEDETEVQLLSGTELDDHIERLHQETKQDVRRSVDYYARISELTSLKNSLLALLAEPDL